MSLLPATGGVVRKAYAPCPYGQLHLHYAAPAADERRANPILLFGANPSSGRLHEEMLAELGRDRLAVAFDPPGLGESSPPPAPVASTLELAAVFITALDHLGIGAVDILGDHTGAMFALGLARQAPARVSRLILGTVPILFDPVLRAGRAGRYPDLEDPAKVAEGERGKWLRWVERRPPDLPLARAVELYADTLTSGVRTNWLFRVAYEDFAGWLPGLATPTLFLRFADCFTVEPERVAGLFTDTRTVSRPDLDHFAFHTRPAEVAAEVRAFCDP